MLKRERKENRKKVHFANKKKTKLAADFIKVDAVTVDEVDKEKRRSRRLGERGDAIEVSVIKVEKKVSFDDKKKKKPQRPLPKGGSLSNQ